MTKWLIHYFRHTIKTLYGIMQNSSSPIGKRMNVWIIYLGLNNASGEKLNVYT